MKSGPELTLGFNDLQIFKMSISDIFENSKLTGFGSNRMVSKLLSDSPISDASVGPIWEKKVLNPLSISK